MLLRIFVGILFMAVASAASAQAEPAAGASASVALGESSDPALRRELASLEARERELSRLPKVRSPWWPALGVVVGFPFSAGFTSTGAIGIADGRRPPPSGVDDHGAAISTMGGAIFVSIGALAFVLGAVCAYRVHRLKRTREARERELDSLYRKQDLLKLELFKRSLNPAP